MNVRKNCGSKKNSPKNLDQKGFGSKNVLGYKKIGSIEILDPKRNWSQIFCGPNS